jgi:hypothetical protein
MVGKRASHDGNIQVITAPDGCPLWTSEVRPGREHDATRSDRALIPDAPMTVARSPRDGQPLRTIARCVSSSQKSLW